MKRRLYEIESEGERHGRIEDLSLKRKADDHQRNFLVEGRGGVGSLFRLRGLWGLWRTGEW